MLNNPVKNSVQHLNDNIQISRNGKYDWNSLDKTQIKVIASNKKALQCSKIILFELFK